METTLDSIRDIKLYQPKKGYRFSVDALLLFSFVNLKTVKRIIDLGAGSGIIGLLLAKKYREAEVTLIELQEGLYGLSKKNILLNNLDNRVRTLRMNIKDLESQIPNYYDLAVSNPPFRKPLTGRLSVDEQKAIARHEIKISLHELVKSASLLLKHHGRFCLVYLPERLPELVEELRRCLLEPKRMRLVHSNADGEAKMLLMEAVKGGRAGLKVEKPLFVYNKDGTYTAEMRRIFS